jgi:SAM-dependent methyltransferase
MSQLLDTLHGRWVHGRRVEVLSRHFAELIPPGARVLDVGCGDGLIGALVRERRPDVEVSGVDIAVRGTTHIPVREFDGRTIPLADGEADVVMLVDVLHHADHPRGLLADAARVAGRAIVLKDVTPLGPLSDPTLRFMDWVGNARHGVPLPYRFWSQPEWRAAFAELGLGVEEVRRRLGLYPMPWGLVFEKRMHFIVRLSPPRDAAVPDRRRR